MQARYGKEKNCKRYEANNTKTTNIFITKNKITSPLDGNNNVKLIMSQQT